MIGWWAARARTNGIALFGVALTLLFLAIYSRTAAPSVLSGDSAEFQMAAATLGVAHPTSYPLYTLLGYLATLALPFGDLARRVTLLSAVCAAITVGLFAALGLRLGLSRRAALLGALALGVTPGLWNAATLAEVYALLALLIVALASLTLTRVGPYPLVVAPNSGERESLSTVLIPSMVAGLGFTHHGLFALTALPPFAIWALLRLRGVAPGMLVRCAGALALGFGTGCLPWLYPLAQYARYGPFDGQDYGLPRHYYWGAPRTWAEALDLLSGGTVRRGIFRIPSTDDALATLTMLRDRALFEFGWIGLALALIGLFVLARRSRGILFASLWVVAATVVYLLALGPAVSDAPIFTLPMLIPIALWIVWGVDQLIASVGRRVGGRYAVLAGWLASGLLLAATIVWADTRVELSSKRHLTLYRTFGEAVLAELPPDAIVIAHWEQGMALQYLRLVERQRPDVWVDVVEPSDEAWGPRARRRYTGRPVFLIGQAPDVAGLPVELVREDDYALLFRLRE